MRYIEKEKPSVREATLEKGFSYPSDEELVMLILGSGTKKTPIRQLANKVVEVLYESNEEDIVKNILSIKGMGVGKTLAIAAALELGRRKKAYLHSIVTKPKDVIPYLKHYSMEQKEHFICVTLNGAHEILQIRVISIGTTNRTIVQPRDIFSEALIENASAIIVCHNHPTGTCEPSDEDIETTKVLMNVADIIGINLLDHIILDRNTYFSFVEHNLLFCTDE